MLAIMKGFFLIDKEAGMTSFDVVREVRRRFGVRKVGHGGTLDPLATGLLIVAVGGATKSLGLFLGCNKEYEVVAHFGAVSDTYDREGKISEADSAFSDSFVSFKRDDIEKVAKASFLGRISQIPPKYSALKIGGRRAADIVRSGGDVTMKPRDITIFDFKLLDFNWPEAKFRVKCSSGTYIRSLVHDLGQKLGCGAYVEELRRTKVGDFDVSDAKFVSDLSEKDLLSPEECDFLPSLTVTRFVK